MVLKGFRSVFNKLLERADVRPQHHGGNDSASTGDANVCNLHSSVLGTVSRETGFHTIHIHSPRLHLHSFPCPCTPITHTHAHSILRTAPRRADRKHSLCVSFPDRKREREMVTDAFNVSYSDDAYTCTSHVLHTHTHTLYNP